MRNGSSYQGFKSFIKNRALAILIIFVIVGTYFTFIGLMFLIFINLLFERILLIVTNVINYR